MIAPEPFFETRGTPFSVFHRSKALGKLGHEIDLILSYNITDAIDINAIYSNTDFGDDNDINALEIYANYKF